MRGKDIHQKHWDKKGRITPAYAGKSITPISDFVVMWDHPRLCGEKRNWDTMTATPGGSPPPMRGKDMVNQTAAACAWITPAYAGKSVPESATHRNKQDHPRLCGEKTDLTILMLNKLGSPPPMRGKEPRPRSASASSGITPAYAGKSLDLE